jgi:DNA repair ATPase RecN
VFQAHTSAEEKFASAIQETGNLLDSLDKPGVNEQYITQQINSNINAMTTMQADNGDAAGKADRAILDVLLKYSQTKSKLSKLGNAAEELEKYKRDLNQCRQELNGAQQTISLMRNSSGF